MTTTQVDILNIGLMVVAAYLALHFPFELFLLAYAVLGPLHYLTELSWLHQRNYFTARKGDSALLYALSALGFCFSVLSGFEERVAGWATFERYEILRHSQLAAITVGFVAFGISLVVGFRRISIPRSLAVAGLAVVGSLIAYSEAAFTYYLLFAVFLPTLIHVSVFTAIFILYGALKNRSFVGVFSVAVYLVCALVVLKSGVSVEAFEVSDRIRDAYELSFGFLNRELLALTEDAPVSAEQVYRSSEGIAITRFIAFAYSYHYLNWFSKTSTIRWHAVSPQRAFAIAVGWVCSVSLFAYSFELGLLAVGFVGLMHIFLEFPLDWIALVGTGREIRTICKHGWRASVISATQ